MTDLATRRLTAAMTVLQAFAEGRTKPMTSDQAWQHGYDITGDTADYFENGEIAGITNAAAGTIEVTIFDKGTDIDTFSVNPTTGELTDH